MVLEVFNWQTGTERARVPKDKQAAEKENRPSSSAIRKREDIKPHQEKRSEQTGGKLKVPPAANARVDEAKIVDVAVAKLEKVKRVRLEKQRLAENSALPA